jgi:hypothetical protein
MMSGGILKSEMPNVKMLASLFKIMLMQLFFIMIPGGYPLGIMVKKN